MHWIVLAELPLEEPKSDPLFTSLKGVDPRNDRRGAVLATRDSNLIDTKES